MDFEVELYETEAGTCPVRDFLDALRVSDPNDFAVVMAGLAKLRHRQYHRPPLSRFLVDGLFELRHVGKLNTRVFWYFARDRRITLVHAVRNKAQAIAPREIQVALRRMRDWQKRMQQR